MERVVPLLGQGPVDTDQALHVADLARQHDLVAPHAQFLGPLCTGQGGSDHGVAYDVVDRLRGGGFLVCVHHPGQQFLVQASPIDADAHRAIVFLRDVDHRRELGIALFAESHVARIDPVFGQRLGAGRMIGQQLVTDIVEIADQRHIDALAVEQLANARHRSGSLRAIDGDTHQFRSGHHQCGNLGGGRRRIGSVGVGHRLHDNRRTAPDGNGADPNGDSLSTHGRHQIFPETIRWIVLPQPAARVNACCHRDRR